MKIAPGTPLRVSLDFGSGMVVPVGRLALDQRVAVFEPAREYVASGLAVNPLLGTGPGLLRARYIATFDGLHGVFADSLPDAWGQELRRRRASGAGFSYASLTGLEKLAAVGRLGMGALSYEPDLGVEKNVGEIDLDLLSIESTEILEGRAIDVTPQLRQLGGSSGGARPKVLVAIASDGRMMSGVDRIPPGYDAWLVKFPGSRIDAPDIGPLEAAYADMARAAGLDVSETRLIENRSGGPGYFATKRFDRVGANGRLHMLSAAGALDADWSEPGVDYDILLRLTRKITRDEREVEKVFRRMVFNVIALNHDDHAKQHAYLMDSTGRWTAAPSYDLTFSQGPGGEHYLAINGEGKDVSLAAIRAVADNHEITQATVATIVEQVAEAAGAFRDHATRYGASTATIKEVGAALEASAKRFRLNREKT